MKYVSAYKMGELNVHVKLNLSRSAVQRMLKEGPQAEAIKDELYNHILAELAKIEVPFQEFDPNDFTETLSQGYSGVHCEEINKLLEQFDGVEGGKLNVTSDLSKGPLSLEELKELTKEKE